MSAYVQVALLVIVALSVDAKPHHPPGGPGQHGPGHHGPHPPLPLGPLHSIMPKLTEEQRQKLFAALEGSENMKKSEVKAKLDQFVLSLSPELQKEVAEAKTKRKNKKAEDDKKVESLSNGAQHTYHSIKQILENDKISFHKMHEEIEKLIKSTSASVIEELKKAGIHLPGLGPHHGEHGPHGKHGKLGPYGKHGEVGQSGPGPHGKPSHNGHGPPPSHNDDEVLSTTSGPQ